MVVWRRIFVQPVPDAARAAGGVLGVRGCVLVLVGLFGGFFGSFLARLVAVEESQESLVLFVVGWRVLLACVWLRGCPFVGVVGPVAFSAGSRGLRDPVLGVLWMLSLVFSFGAGCASGNYCCCFGFGVVVGLLFGGVSLVFYVILIAPVTMQEPKEPAVVTLFVLICLPLLASTFLFWCCLMTPSQLFTCTVRAIDFS
jgi:hypothetical protein